MKHPCLFSVVIPTFNRAKYLREALESVFLQDVPGLQVIVIDDGSTDDTRSVAAEYGSRVEYVYQENRGPGAARNHGVRRARGEFVAFLDSDDVWLPGKLPTEWELFRALPEAGAMICDCQDWMDGKLRAASWFQSYVPELSFDQPAFMPESPPCWVRGSLFATSCITVRRAALDRFGPEPFDSSIRVFEDWHFEILLFRFCRVYIVPSILARIRIFDDGTRAGRDSASLGQESSPEEHDRNLATLMCQVLANALAMGGWSEEVVEKLKEAQRKHSKVIARCADGQWHDEVVASRRRGY
jgi:glycosyltransferase involved in cell wall biosynthesis